MLCHAVDADGEPLTDLEVRDDVVALFVAGTETSALALTWFLVTLDERPEIAAKVYEEIDRVVGSSAPSAAHVPHLTYTAKVLHEVLRLYPAVWLIPRTVGETDVIGGVRLRKGATVIVSPYLTHRLTEFWARADDFDPERFDASATEDRHRYSYVPFIGGPHQCLGNHFFIVEAQLIAATLLQRYRPVPVRAGPVLARAAATLRPRRRVRVRLHPRHPTPDGTGEGTAVRR
jgi:cytochrome P450